MNFLINKALFLTIILLICSCNNKKFSEKPVEIFSKGGVNTETVGFDIKALFDELNENAFLNKMSIEYYKNIILQDETSRRYLELNDIMEIEYFIPGLLCFMVRWTDFEGYVYKLYAFDNKQNIVNIYSCGNGFPVPYTKLLTQNIPGTNFGEYVVVSDINNDGINEIISFSFWNFPLFSIYGFDILENRFKAYLEASYFFDYYKPSSPARVESNNGGNEIVILEIVDKDTYDYEWLRYIFDKESRIYKRK